MRRFLIEALDLSGARPYDSAPPIRPVRVLQEIRRLECVQLDPVAAVARNQHLVLAARLPGYTTQSLDRLLAERRVFEYWANAACVIPIEDYWMFEGVRQRLRKYVRKERGLLRRPVSYVLRELARSGPMSSRAFTTVERIAGYWNNKGPKTKATTHALNILWVTGEVLVVRREGMERHFHLPHEVVPAEQLRRAEETDPREANRALLEKYIRTFRIFDLGGFRFGWQKIPAPRRRPLIERYLKEGTVVPLDIDGVRRKYFALAEDIEQIRRHERGGGASFSNRLIVRVLGFEPHVRPSASLRRRLDRALEGIRHIPWCKPCRRSGAAALAYQYHPQHFGGGPMVHVDEQQTAAEREWLDAWLSGPRRTTWTKMPPQPGDAAPDFPLSDASGHIRRLSEFWQESPVLLLFLRHFGCSCLAERWEKLRDEVAEFETAGAKVVAIGQGEPERTAEVARRRGYPFPVLSDPERRAYEAYGLLEGSAPQILHDFAWTPNDRETGEKLISSRRGTERALVDNPWQLPGEFVIATGGRLVHAHRYQYCEDFPPKTVLLGAIAAAAR